MSKQKRNRRATRKAAGAEAGPAPQTTERAGADPIIAALRMMQDEGQPAALRARMAKAAMAARDGAPASGVPDPYPHPSSLEVARRMAVILNRANDELRAAELAAEGWDVKVRGMPVDNTDWARIMGRLVAILSSCHSPIESLDRAGIRF
jgi:hypothetical protein